ncbi:zinc-binding protein A33-like isoform X2 [Protopterus annectens]|uniref:zinc-binding protein A33-like isoform X2 n=1 Tax=Protopterus annectens TaxID=7888 RepID=UPI001CFA9D75|nr:zinc-binding protein A33-like isoform X2 [Protopterus annectens]
MKVALQAGTFLLVVNETETLKQSVSTMASSNHAGDFMEEFICSVCLELLNVPVTLECGHNFCKSCIDRVWEIEKQPSCPECREEFTARKYAMNRLLANVIKRVQIQCEKEGPNPCQKDHLCMEHKKRPELFCEEDEVLVCSLCVPEHRGHNFLTVQKALEMYKDKLTTFLSHQQSSLKHFKEVKYQQETKISEIRMHATNLHFHIISEFANLHQFLKVKEENLVQQLKEEENEILKEMEENLSKIKEDINAFQESISSIQLQVQRQDALTFLKEMKSFSGSFTSDNDPSVVANDLSLGVHKSPVQYFVWKEMEAILKPEVYNISFDTKTAHPNVIFAEGLASITYGYVRKQLPDNLERFDPTIYVVGSNGFTSGRHYCEVEVANKTKWVLGVARESINRKGKITISPEAGFWTLSLSNGNEYTANESPAKALSLSVKPHKICVYLDYEGGQVSFYTADSMSHLYTFRDTFTGRLYPIISPGIYNVGINIEYSNLFNLKP